MDNLSSLQRPKPGDDEEELFRMQENFFKSKEVSSAKVINLRSQNGQVTNELINKDDEITENKPSKYRSKFAERRARGQESKLSTSQSGGDIIKPEIAEQIVGDKHPEELIDSLQNIPLNPSRIVMGYIVEKHYDNQTQNLFKQSQDTAGEDGFPQVFKIDDNNSTVNNSESLFYKSIKKRASVKSDSSENIMDIDPQIKYLSSFDKSGVVQGSLGAEIHKENLDKLSKMSQEEILKQKAYLENTLSPDLIKFLQSKKRKTSQEINNEVSHSRRRTEIRENADNAVNKIEKMECKEELEDPPVHVVEIVEQATEQGWIHMDELESSKLEWMKDILSTSDNESIPEKPYNARFNFAGMLLPFNDDNLTIDKGLHHHGEEPERPGYSLQELLQLSRSAAQQQRCTALTTLGNIMEKSREGLYDKILDPPPLSALHQRNIMLLLRFSLDDTSVAVVTAALQALRSFLYSEADEICLDRLHGWNYQDGACVIPELLAPKNDVEDTCELKDHELAQLDCVAAALRSDIVLRIRYILSVMHPPPVGVSVALEILIRFIRHSRTTALNIATTPQLLDVIVHNFIPLSTQRLVDTELLSDAYGVPNVSAVRLCRILLEYAGRPVADRLNHLKIIHSLMSYITTDTGEAGLQLSIEAIRLWRLLIISNTAKDSLLAASQLLATQLQLLMSNHDLANSSELACEYAVSLIQLSGCEISLKPIISTLLSKWSTQLASVSSVTWCNTKLIAISLEAVDDISVFKVNCILNAKIFNNICSTSNLLSGFRLETARDPSSLPSFGVIIQDGQLQPAITLNSCFPFLSTVYNFLIKATKFNKLKLILSNADVIKYLRRLAGTDWSLQNSWYTRSELSFITAVVRSNALLDTGNTINELIWKIAVKLISVLPSDNVDAVKEVLEIIFSNEKLTIQRITNNLNELKLNNSAEMVPFNLPTNIANIYVAYISCEKSWCQQAMPCDWPYLPLVDCYTHYKNSMTWNDNDISKIITLLSLEMTMSELFQDLSPTLRFTRIILVYLCETVYLHKTISILLSNVMGKLISRYYKTFDFTNELPGLTSFTDLFTVMSECFCANSYGDDNFSMALLVPLTQRHNIHYRKMLWSEHASALRYLKLPVEKLLIPLSEFLHPLEDDPSLIENYITALVRKTVRKEWCPVLYAIAIHHSAMFLRGTSKLAMRMRAGIMSIKDANLAECMLNYVTN